jgi:hypothetical protein
MSNDLVFLRHLCIACTGSGMFRYPRAIWLEREVSGLLESVKHFRGVSCMCWMCEKIILLLGRQESGFLLYFTLRLWLILSYPLFMS